jgi:hypothetical protein
VDRQAPSELVPKLTQIFLHCLTKREQRLILSARYRTFIQRMPRESLHLLSVNGSSDDCSRLCLRNCSCAAAFFLSSVTTDGGAECFLVPELLSMPATSLGRYQYSAFIKYYEKVALGPNAPPSRLRLGLTRGVVERASGYWLLVLGVEFCSSC